MGRTTASAIVQPLWYESVLVCAWGGRGRRGCGGEPGARPDPIWFPPVLPGLRGGRGRRGWEGRAGLPGTYGMVVVLQSQNSLIWEPLGSWDPILDF